MLQFIGLYILDELILVNIKLFDKSFVLLVVLEDMIFFYRWYLKVGYKEKFYVRWYKN